MWMSANWIFNQSGICKLQVWRGNEEDGMKCSWRHETSGVDSGLHCTLELCLRNVESIHKLNGWNFVQSGGGVFGELVGWLSQWRGLECIMLKLHRNTCKIHVRYLVLMWHELKCATAKEEKKARPLWKKREILLFLIVRFVNAAVSV